MKLNSCLIRTQSVCKAVRDFLPKLRLAFRVRCVRAGLGRPCLSAGVRPCPLCQWDSLECGHAHSWELSSGYRDPRGPWSRKHLLSSHLQKRFDDPASGLLLSPALPKWECPAGPLFWADETLALAAPQGMQVRGWEPLPMGNAPSAASSTWARCGAQPLAISAVVSQPPPRQALPGGATALPWETWVWVRGSEGGGWGARKKEEEREGNKTNQYPSLQL